VHVAIAEVVAELDIRGNVACEPKETLEDAALDVVEPDRKDALEHPELEVRVPLDGELIVGYLLKNLVEFRKQPCLVERLDHGLMLADHEREDRRERGGQAALKAAGDGNDGVSLQTRERAV